MRCKPFSYNKWVIQLLCIGYLTLFNMSACRAQKQDSTSIEQQILYYTNRFRADHHLTPLKLNDFISEEASGHSADMASGRVPFGHDGFQQRTNALRTKLGAVATGENVAYGQLSAKQVVNIWIHSAPHRKNLLGNYSMMGIGVATGGEGLLFFTQLFAR